MQQLQLSVRFRVSKCSGSLEPQIEPADWDWHNLGSPVQRCSCLGRTWVSTQCVEGSSTRRMTSVVAAAHCVSAGACCRQRASSRSDRSCCARQAPRQCSDLGSLRGVLRHAGTPQCWTQCVRWQHPTLDRQDPRMGRERRASQPARCSPARAAWRLRPGCTHCMMGGWALTRRDCSEIALLLTVLRMQACLLAWEEWAWLQGGSPGPECAARLLLGLLGRLVGCCVGLLPSMSTVCTACWGGITGTAHPAHDVAADGGHSPVTGARAWLQSPPPGPAGAPLLPSA